MTNMLLKRWQSQVIGRSNTLQMLHCANARCHPGVQWAFVLRLQELLTGIPLAAEGILVFLQLSQIVGLGLWTALHVSNMYRQSEVPGPQ